MDDRQARQRLDQLLEQGEIRPPPIAAAWIYSTHANKPVIKALHCASAEAVERWGRRRAALARQPRCRGLCRTVWIGHGHTYGCIEQMLSCIDTALLVELLNQQEQAAQ